MENKLHYEKWIVQRRMNCTNVKNGRMNPTIGQFLCYGRINLLVKNESKNLK